MKKGPTYTQIEASNQRLARLKELGASARERLRREILRGRSDYEAAQTAGVDVDHAAALRERLRELNVLPPEERPRVVTRTPPPDPRQLPLLP